MRAHEDTSRRREQLAAWLAAAGEGLRINMLPVCIISFWMADAVARYLGVIPRRLLEVNQLAMPAFLWLFCVIIALRQAMRFLQRERARQDWQSGGGRVIGGLGDGLAERVELLQTEIGALKLRIAAQDQAWAAWHEIHPEDPYGRQSWGGPRRTGLSGLLALNLGGGPVVQVHLDEREPLSLGDSQAPHVLDVLVVPVVADDRRAVVGAFRDLRFPAADHRVR